MQAESDHVDTDVKVLLLLPCNCELVMNENYCDGWMIMFLWVDFVLFTNILALNRFWYCKKNFFFLSEFHCIGRHGYISIYFLTLLKQRVGPTVTLSAVNNAPCLWPNFSLLMFSLCLEWVTVTNKSLKIRTYNGKADKTLNNSRAMGFGINNIITEWIWLSSWNFTLLFHFLSNCLHHYFIAILTGTFQKLWLFIDRLLP